MEKPSVKLLVKRPTTAESLEVREKCQMENQPLEYLVRTQASVEDQQRQKSFYLCVEIGSYLSELESLVLGRNPQ